VSVSWDAIAHEDAVDFILYWREIGGPRWPKPVSREALGKLSGELRQSWT
jgi:hypothetical protein